VFLNALLFCLLSVLSFNADAQGLDGIIVEEFHTITQADADAYNNDFGGGGFPLVAGMKTYRVFVDMAPNYELIQVYGAPIPTGGTVSPNPLDFTTTTTFWNDDNFGTELPAQTRRFDEGTLFDSYITAGTSGISGGTAGCGSNLAQVGVPRTSDTNGDLTTCGVYPGFTGNDGHLPGTGGALTYNLGGTMNFAALQANGNNFTVVNESWGVLGGNQGVDPTGTNRILVAQFTTNGVFSFHINVQLSSPSSVLETYVWNNAAPGETLRPELTYPLAAVPDCNGVPGGAALPGTSCNDNNACTINDIWSPTCVCAGTVQDTDGDGTCDANDGCPTDPNKTVPGACGCGVADVATTYYADVDGDGFGAGAPIAGFTCTVPPGTVTNNTDGCPSDPNKQAPGVCGCGVADVATTYYADVDGDGFGDPANSQAGFTCSVPAGFVTNNTDGCPADPNKQAPGVCGCGVADTDTDNDGLADCVDPCPAGPNPGASCNDNNACTINDVVGSNCQCAGTFQDSDSDGVCDANDNCPNLSGQQGDACNDGNAATINDVITANCVCAGVQPNDCLGVPGGTAQPGTSCNDNNAATGNDTWSANCVCVGQLIDCLNVPGGSALPGTSCNDNNACTINDVYQANCSCAGTIQDSDSDGICDANDNCPNLAGVQGDACNDGNAATINDVITANCVCVGTLLGNDCLGVPGGSAQPGTSCDDGLATTGNDTWNANCVCVGQLIDCLNVPGGSALPGTACNDNNAGTTNDVWSANCVCAGTPLPNDCLGVPGGSAQPGTACNDNDPNTGNDTWSANCACVGTPLITDCLGIPGGTALPGTACNDNNAGTINDTWSANCVCVGTTVTCVDWTLTISTDGAGSETTWQIVDASNSAVIGSGGPYANNTTVTETICIPFGGCFNLIVSDAGGNGITGGGYVLRDDAGNRVIDNAGNGAAFTTTSQAAQPFCSPVGSDKLLNSSCDKENWNPNQFIIASTNAAVSAQFGVGNQTDDGYEFWFFNPNGGYSRRVFISHASPNTGAPAGVNAAAHLRFSSITSNPVPANVLLNVRVRTRVNGVSSVYGPACRFKLEVPPSLCATTQLVPTQGSTFSCGATGKIVGASGSTGRIHAVPATRIVSGSTQSANRYQFQMSVPAEGYVRNIQTTSTTLVLAAWPTNPLLCGTFTYNVIVRASFDNGATWCPYGNSCTVGITNNQAAPFCTAAGSAFAGNGDRIFTDGDEVLVSTLSMWPNPNRGEQLFITIDRLDTEVTTATVDIFDLVGKKVNSRIIPVNGTTLNTVIDLDGSLSGGIYVVNLTAGEQTFTQRLVIQ
jgi:hypothetical protein